MPRGYSPAQASQLIHGGAALAPQVKALHKRRSITLSEVFRQANVAGRRGPIREGVSPRAERCGSAPLP